MERGEEIMNAVRHANGNEAVLMRALADLARRDVRQTLAALGQANSETPYETLARLGERLASAAGLVLAAGGREKE